MVHGALVFSSFTSYRLTIDTRCSGASVKIHQWLEINGQQFLCPQRLQHAAECLVCLLGIILVEKLICNVGRFLLYKYV